ncbi:MAG: hypothetical protein KTR19_06635 [Hyphomicrobiales bacterium]|nr:hypothetical protein [Hyphomicrobiales bacterium]
MRRFFSVLFLVSIMATGAAYYWRTYQPEQTVAASAPAAEDSAETSAQRRGFGTRSLSPENVTVVREPSDRQDMAMMISLISSVISALAAVFQTWMTARSVRSRA